MSNPPSSKPQELKGALSDGRSEETRAPKYSSHALLTPANGFTFIRIAATPLVLLLIAGRHHDLLTLLFWCVICATDWVDGVLARKYGLSKSGAFFDPLADKFLVLGAMFVLVAKHEFWMLPVGLITFREVAMSVYRSAVGRKGISVPASKPAKFKTLTQQLCVGFAIAPWFGKSASAIAHVLLWVSVALTLYTGGQYLAAARRHPPYEPAPTSN